MPPAPFDLCFVIDDDEDILFSAKLAIRKLFRDVETFRSPEQAVKDMVQRLPDAILLDANFSRGATNGAEGFHWLARLLEIDPDAAIVLITAHGGIQLAVEAMKRGATDFVSKPWANERLMTTVRNAVELRRSRKTTLAEKAKTRTIATPVASSPLLGCSPAMARVQSLIERAGPTDANVLILGENGTGKELAARQLHAHSLREKEILLSVDLGAIAESVIDSELFGHVKGAFTDARADRVGRFQAADGGTLFLDELGNLPLHLQPKLLTALEQRSVTPVGSTRPTPFDVRVVSATNLPHHQLGDENRIRPDLLFRLRTVEIELPPLRDRREDIPMLLEHYVAQYSRRYNKPERALSSEALSMLMAYGWPGNVRELRHAAERAVILSESNVLIAPDFPLPRSHAPGPALGAAPPAVAPETVPEDLNLDRVERQTVERALKKHGYNISNTATELGLTRGALYRRMEKHGL